MKGKHGKHKMKEYIIKTVESGSIAEELELEPGDILLSINSEEIEDIFDYRFIIKDEYLEVAIRKKNGEEWILEIDKEFDEDLGIEFENSLMSEYRSCCNKCIFCFIDQMPPGMRETLYFKDDDSRLSFLQGNYITMTNMKEKDIDRIIRMHLSPINISVQTTNPDLRCKMLNNRFAGEKLKYLQRLYEGNVQMNGQIVCCKNVNDGDELRRTIKDLSKYLPYMRSVSVVPAGITKYREGLYPIETFNREEAGEVIDIIEGYQRQFYKEYGIHFVHASDEWYINAEREFPEEDRYDGYVQLENGVGMMRIFIDEFKDALEQLTNSKEYPKLREKLQRVVTIAVGKLTYPTMKKFTEQMEILFPGLTINIFYIRNDFFGETITVSGLITGKDLVKQIKERQDNGEELGRILNIPSNMLRIGEQVFLDDMTVAEVETKLGMKLVTVESGGKDFIEAIINPDYSINRDNGNFVYIQAYDR